MALDIASFFEARAERNAYRKIYMDPLTLEAHSMHQSRVHV